MSDRMWDKISFKCMVNKKKTIFIFVCALLLPLSQCCLSFFHSASDALLAYAFISSNHPSGPQHLQIAPTLVMDM